MKRSAPRRAHPSRPIRARPFVSAESNGSCKRWAFTDSLGLVKGNKTFLEYIPAAMNSLRGLVAEIPDLEKLSVALDRVS